MAPVGTLGGFHVERPDDENRAAGLWFRAAFVVGEMVRDRGSNPLSRTIFAGVRRGWAGKSNSSLTGFWCPGVTFELLPGAGHKRAADRRAGKDWPPSRILPNGQRIPGCAPPW